MLQFYYDFIDRYVDRSLFQYCEMDTDSAYIALAGESIDDLVRPELREHFFQHRSEWLPAVCCDAHKGDYVETRLAGRTWTATEPCCLARKAFDKRTPGLFKVEWCGDGFIGLCSKTYYCFGATNKCTTKGLNKRQNNIDKDAFLDVLTNRRSGSGVNRGFRVHNSTVMTYVQEREALTYFYAKRKVLADRPNHCTFGHITGLNRCNVRVCCCFYHYKIVSYEFVVVIVITHCVGLLLFVSSRHGHSLATPIHVYRCRTDWLW